ncbi:MAG: hypothetical protein KatS3mg005_2881 [Bryobacteraceae bacterium]|nr:MAG: hypothetical protein KatS3mg005_2881 [Bryobacteraceae bacterium]
MASGRRPAAWIALAAMAAWGQVRIRPASYESAEHFVVKTAAAEWWYDAAGGGFSRIVDRDGRDWIGFRREPWNVTPASAASSYRGLPNLVFGGEKSGAGHPGFTHCRSRVDGGRIVTETQDGSWRWQWRFEDSHAVLEIEKKGPEPYWFLYEGVPGGRYAPARWYWGNEEAGPVREMPDFLAGGRSLGAWRWAYFGAEDEPRVFWVARLGQKGAPASFGVMGASRPGLEAADGMTVFGFGRARDARPLLEEAPAVFLCGFFESRIRNAQDHRRIARHIESRMARAARR